MLILPTYESRYRKSTAKLFLVLLLVLLTLSQPLSGKLCCKDKLKNLKSSSKSGFSKVKKAVLTPCKVFTLGLGLGYVISPIYGGDAVIRQIFSDTVNLVNYKNWNLSGKRQRELDPPKPILPPPPTPGNDKASAKSWFGLGPVDMILAVVAVLFALVLLITYCPFLNDAYNSLVHFILRSNFYPPAGGAGEASPAGEGGGVAPAVCAAPEGSTSASNSASVSSSAVQQQQFPEQQQQLPQNPPISPAFGPVWRDPPRTPLLIPPGQVPQPSTTGGGDPQQLDHYPGGPPRKKLKRHSPEQQHHFGTPVPPSLK